MLQLTKLGVKRNTWMKNNSSLKTDRGQEEDMRDVIRGRRQNVNIHKVWK